MIGSKNIYSDTLISATDFNRQPGRVLDLALKHPVTITRNDEAFALLRREDAARMIEASTHVELLVEIIQVIYRLLLGRSPQLTPRPNAAKIQLQLASVAISFSHHRRPSNNSYNDCASGTGSVEWGFSSETLSR